MGLIRTVKLAVPLWVKELIWKVAHPANKANKRIVYESVLPSSNRITKNSDSEKRCFIIGGGPSINLMDLTPLNHEHCMAVNRGFLLKNKGLHRVDFYGLSDVNAYREYGHLIPADFAKHFCIFGAIPWARTDIENLSVFSMYSPQAPKKFMSKGFFQFNLNQPVAHTYSVVLQMLQVAVFAGFRDIYIIGVDNDFSGTNMHFYPDSTTEKHNMKIWGLNPSPDNEEAFRQAYLILKPLGINLYNAGVGGKLTALPRVEFKELF